MIYKIDCGIQTVTAREHSGSAKAFGCTTTRDTTPGWTPLLLRLSLTGRHTCLRDRYGCVDVYVVKPKSVKREYPTVKPDATNYAKAVEDALNKLIWIDDAQVVDQRCRKFYGNPWIWNYGFKVIDKPEEIKK